MDYTYKFTHKIYNFVFMRRFIVLLASLTVSVSLFAQAQITTKKEKLKDFPLKTMKVVLTGNEFVDPALRDAVKNTWSLSTYEFCTAAEFNASVGNEEYYFMLPALTRYRKENEPGILMLTVLKGTSGAKSPDDMTEVTSIPMCSAASPSGRESAMLPGLVDIIQGYISKSLQSGFFGLGSYTGKISKSGIGRALVAESDVAGDIDAKILNTLRRKGLEIVPDEVADNTFANGDEDVLVSYSVAPAVPGNGSVCWKLLMDSRRHGLFYYRKEAVSTNGRAGFSKSDLRKIAGKLQGGRK